MDTLTQVERLIELAIIQRSELRRLVEELPQLKAHLSEEIERTFEETEPQLRAELEEWTTKQTADKTAALGVALEAKIADLAKSLEVSTQARYNAIIAEREENARLAAQAEAKIAEHAASLPGAVKEIVSAELARFPRAGEIDQLRKEFAEPKSLNPRGKWQAGETYNKLDLVTINGDSYVSNIDGNTEKPSRSAANWTLNAARGNSGGGGGITSLNDILNAPTSGQIIGSENSQYVPKTLVAGTGITITDDPSTITIDASGAQEILTATVKNAESVAITRGQVVYLFSATGGFPSVKLAYNTSDATSAKTFGVVSDVSIAPNGTGTITCVGVVSNLNLGAYNDGDTVYLGATPGSFTATKPYAPNHLVYVGIIERANAGNGELYVRIQNGYELDEIHDVQINSPKLAGQTLIYDATTDLWKNARLTAGVGVSISNGDSAITISADGGVNYQGTWNASTNTPTLTSSVGTKGFYYVVSVAGSTNLNGVTDWKVGDWAIFNGTAWEKVDTTDQVSSVFGRTGAVVGVSTDYSAVGITNTAIGASNPSTGAFTTLSATGNLTVSGIGTIGSGGTGATTGTLLLSGSSANDTGPYITFSRNSVAKGYIGTASGVTGGSSDNLVVYTSALAATFSGANTTLSGNLTVSGGGATFGASGGGDAVLSLKRASDGLTVGNLTVNTSSSLLNLGTAYTFLTFSTEGTEKARFSASTGNLLIGTITDGGQKLQVAGSAKFNFATNTNITLSGSGTISTISSLNDAGNAYQPLFVSGSVLTFNIGGSESARFAATTGNLLIGTTTDGGQKLQVSGDVSVLASGSTIASFGRTATSPANAGWSAGADNDGGYISTLQIAKFRIFTGGTTALTLDSSQNATFAGTVGSALGFRGTKSVVVSSDTTVEIAADSGLGGIYQITVSGSNRVQRVLVSVAAQQYDNAKISVLSNYTYGSQAVLSNFRVTSNAGNTVRALICDVGNRNGASVTVSASAMFDTNGSLTLVSPSTYTTAVTTVYPMSVAAGPSASDLTLGGNLTVSGGVTAGADSTISGSGNTTLNIKTSDATKFASIVMGTTGTQPNQIFSGAESYGSFAGARSLNLAAYGPIAFYAQETSVGSYTERMRLNTAGNLLIGTTTDGGQKLQVSGEILSSPSGAGYLVFTTHGSKNTGVYYNGSQGVQLYTNNLPALALSSTQVATFYGSLVYLGNGFADLSCAGNNLFISTSDAARGIIFRTGSYSTALTLDSSQNATFSGNIKTAAPSGGTAATWKLGTVASVSPTSPNRTIEVEIGGTTYYIHAKTTNN